MVNGSDLTGLVKDRHNALASVLIDAGLEVNTEVSGNNPLMHAVINHDVQMFEKLRDNRATIITQAQANLMFEKAFESDKLSLTVVKSILKQVGDVNVLLKNGMTPLIKAVQQWNKDVVKELIKHKASLSVVNSKGETPLHEAAR